MVLFLYFGIKQEVNGDRKSLSSTRIYCSYDGSSNVTFFFSAAISYDINLIFIYLVFAVSGVSSSLGFYEFLTGFEVSKIIFFTFFAPPEQSNVEHTIL